MKKSIWKKIAREQRGSALAIVTAFILVAVVGTASIFIGLSASGVQTSQDFIDLQNTYNAYNSCIQKFNNTSDLAQQVSSCEYGECLNLDTGDSCSFCGEDDTEWPAGICSCQMKFLDTDIVSDRLALFSISGICDKAIFSRNITLSYCAPDCLGRECGDDGCGGSCGECLGVQVCNDGQCD